MNLHQSWEELIKVFSRVRVFAGVLEYTELPELFASKINYVAFINQTCNMEPGLELDLTFQKSGREF